MATTVSVLPKWIYNHYPQSLPSSHVYLFLVRYTQAHLPTQVHLCMRAHMPIHAYTHEEGTGAAIRPPDHAQLLGDQEITKHVLPEPLRPVLPKWNFMLIQAQALTLVTIPPRPRPHGASPQRPTWTMGWAGSGLGPASARPEDTKT